MAAQEIMQDAPDADGKVAFDYADGWGVIERTYEDHKAGQAMANENVSAFLAMIAASEGTSQAVDPYRVCYAYKHTIKSFADHPAVTKEWAGEKLSDAMCKGAGLGPGCVSTAAGRYQLIRPTWLMCKRALGLPDFGHESQDKAAVYLMRKSGALDDIEAGRIDDAINKCRAEWASLPGAGYGQPERKKSFLLAAYTGAGGQLSGGIENEG